VPSLIGTSDSQAKCLLAMAGVLEVPGVFQQIWRTVMSDDDCSVGHVPAVLGAIVFWDG
jgi:hypothetical protein